MGTLRGLGSLRGFLLFSALSLGSGCLSSGQIESLSKEALSQEQCLADPGICDVSSTTSVSGTTAYRLRGTTSAPFPYVEYLPGGYSENPGKKWPVIIMLHGLGEQGQGNTQSDLARAAVHGPNRRTREGRHFPAVILTPMTPVWWDDTATCQFLDYALANYRIESRRVYVTGLSMGGGGTWGMGGKCANKIAAIVPICGAAGANGTYATNLLNQKVSIWAFHNQDDGTVGIGNSDGWMDAFGGLLTSSNTVRSGNPSGNPTKTAHQRADRVWEWIPGVSPENASGYDYPRQLHYTVYPSGGHDAWTKTYANEALWTWLFMQIKL